VPEEGAGLAEGGDPMNALRLLVAGVLTCVLAIGARAEGQADNAKLLVGTWEAVKSFENGPPVGAVVAFAKDGKIKDIVKVDGKEVVYEGTYKVDGDTLTVLMKKGDKEEKTVNTIKKINDADLILAIQEGKLVELKRKK
jgi:uncharacterized protein (TIGR03066 family)